MERAKIRGYKSLALVYLGLTGSRALLRASAREGGSEIYRTCEDRS